MSLTPEQITAQNFKDFYDGIKPYLNSYIPFQSHFNRGDLYSTDEKIIGQWIDGKPIYQQTIVLPATITLSADTWLVTSVPSTTKEQVINVIGHRTVEHGGLYVSLAGNTNAGNGLEIKSGVSCNLEMLTLQYTKTTDSVTNIGLDTDYSTDEKIVGTWTDGKPIYQKTFIFTNYTLTTLDSWRFLVDVPDLHISNNCCFITNSYFVQSAGNFTNTNQIATMSGGSSAYTKSFAISFDTRHLTSEFSANDCLNIITSVSLSNVTLVFTLQYTKTTD